MKTVWQERAASRQSEKSGQSLGSTMTKVGGTAKRNKFNPTRPRSRAVDASTTWTSPDSGLEVHIIININNNNKI